MNKNIKKQEKIILNGFKNHIKIFNYLNSAKTISKINKIFLLILKTLKSNNSIFWCGNGGSASDTQHLSTELVARYEKERKPLRSISLNTDTSALTAIANDYDYSEVFSRQLEALSKKNDLLIVISTSGKSKNIINVLKMAKKLKVKSVAFLGNNGGASIKIADLSFVVPSNVTARIQEFHIFLGHLICELLDNYYTNKK